MSVRGTFSYHKPTFKVVDGVINREIQVTVRYVGHLVGKEAVSERHSHQLFLLQGNGQDVRKVSKSCPNAD